MEIFKAISAINKEIEAVSKDKKNQQQGYKFRGIDDMYNALHDLFAKHNVFITSEVLNSKREFRETKSGGNVVYTVSTCKFNFYTSDGSFVSSTLDGEAMDSGDKSTNKAMSAALKYALMQMFLIPTEERLDIEHDSHEFKAEPKKQNISDDHLNVAIDRIKNGDKSLKEKILNDFNLTPTQKIKINNI